MAKNQNNSNADPYLTFTAEPQKSPALIVSEDIDTKQSQNNTSIPEIEIPENIEPKLPNIPGLTMLPMTLPAQPILPGGTLLSYRLSDIYLMQDLKDQSTINKAKPSLASNAKKTDNKQSLVKKLMEKIFPEKKDKQENSWQPIE